MKTTTNTKNSVQNAHGVQKNSLVMFVMITVLISLFNTNIKANSLFKPGYDSLTVLEVEGKLLNPAGGYTVELVSNSGHIDTLVVNSRNKFRFLLNKDSYYTIRLSMQGHVTKLVSVNTEIFDETDGLYRFTFETTLLKEEALVHLNKDVTDMPIAIIYFDHDSNNFVYSKKYTENLKKEMRKGKALSQSGNTITTTSKGLANAYSR
jgi:hypothetical protein